MTSKGSFPQGYMFNSLFLERGKVQETLNPIVDQLLFGDSYFSLFLKGGGIPDSMDFSGSFKGW